ncbi:LysR family transcriptional regulator [Rhizobium deserti]|uniref:HTH-type transcriptional regulator TtuA n=1 Tax=Rhizobium deserti TaxID=2547961 RepID=A0A4R5UMY0_9HYPH|nr:LysR family transcriptional regulator [Rhizobium deserti]TDK39236.1 LysR family transcriptional regulator [Rhizobium deserti]
MNIRDVEALIAVIETGSVVAAAARLRITQPGLTRRIQNLEDHLGARLLERDSKPYKPTAAGIRAYEHGRKILREIDAFRAHVSPGSGMGGVFRFGFMPHVSEEAVTSGVAALRESFPKLFLKLSSGWSSDLAERVVRRELDAAVVFMSEGAAPVESGRAIDLGLLELVVVAPRSYGLSNRTMLQDLAEYPWVLNQTGCGFRNYVRQSLNAANLPFDVAVEVADPSVRLALVASGHGIGLTTPSAVHASRWRSELMVVETPDFRPIVRMWLLHGAGSGILVEPVDVLAACFKSVAKEGGLLAA